MMGTIKNYNNEELFFKIWRNAYLRYLILSNLYSSEFLIDNKVINELPLLPKSLNNILIKKGVGFCNWFVKSLFLSQIIETDEDKEEEEEEEEEVPNKIELIKNLLKNEGIDQYSFLSRFQVNSFLITNYNSSVYQDYGYLQEQPPSLKIKKLNVTWSKYNNLNQDEQINLKNYLNSKSDRLTIDNLSLLLNSETTNGNIQISNIKTLEIRDQKDEIKSNQLPQTIKKLKLCDGYNHQLSIDMVPESVLKLDLGYIWNQNLISTNIPSSITNLNLGETFNYPFEKNNNLTNNIKILKLGSKFTHFSSLSNLNENCHTIEFSDNFNTKLVSGEFNLPNSITFLKFGNSFNQEIDNGTFNNSNNLKTLKLGSSFSKKLTNQNLPSCILNLEISYNCKLIIDDDIFEKYYSIKNQLCNNGNHLSINKKHGSNFIIPKNCNSITFEDNYYLEFGKNIIIPKFIKYLEFGKNFKNNNNNSNTILIRSRDIPNITTHLSIQSNDVLLDFIPPSITHFKTCSTYSHPINILTNYSKNLLSLKTRLLNIKYLNQNEFKPIIF